MPRRVLASFAFFWAFVLWTTWPLARHVPATIPLGFETSPTVPLLNLWTVGWNANRTSQGWSDYWAAPHFFPDAASFWLSEPLVTTQIVAPVVWLTGTPVVACNLFLMSSLFLNGWVTWSVLLARGHRWPIAALGGCTMIRLPFVCWQLGVLQSVGVAGIIATIHFTSTAFATGRRQSFVWAGTCLGLTYLTCAHYGLFTALLLPACACSALALSWKCGANPSGGAHPLGLPFFRGNAPSKRWSVGIVWGIAVAATLIGPIAVAQGRALSSPAYERPRELIRDLSALPGDYLETPFPELLRFVGVAQWHDPKRWALSPGLWKCLLAVVGMWLGVRSLRRRSWTLFLATLTLGAFVGSLGLNLTLMGWSPYQTLLDWVPGLAKVRAPGRFAVFVQLGVVLLGMESLHYLQRWGTIRWRQSKRRRMSTLARPVLEKSISRDALASGCARGEPDASAFRLIRQRANINLRINNWPLAVVWLAGLLACFEVSLPTTRLVEIPAVETQRGWIGWLTRNTPREAVVAHLPFPAGKLAKDYEPEVWAMYWGLFHQRRMVNGYSGFFPPSYLKLKEQVQRFPDPESLAALRANGVSYCVIPRAFVESHGLANDKAPQQLERVFCDDLAGTMIFRLHE